MLDGLDGLVVSLDMKVAIRRPGYTTIRKEVKNWHEINALVIELAGGQDYPRGTVMTVDDWTGRERFSLRGGKNAPARLVKLTSAVQGLPENPKMATLPASPSLPGKAK